MPKKITDLPSLTSADATDIVPLVDQSTNTTKQTTVAGLAAAVTANTPDNTITPAMRTRANKLGIIAGSTLGSTGNKAITGVGFAPRIIEFTVLPTSSAGAAATAIEGTGIADGTTQFCWYTSSNGSAQARYSSQSQCIAWGSNPTNTTPNLAVAFVSLDTDGFTINVTTASSTFDIGWEAIA